MPMEQIEIEKSVHLTKLMDIEVDNTQGCASEDINVLLQTGSTVDGWQIVTPKKNRKKAKNPPENIQDSNKRLHSDSPLKERLPKRQATTDCSDISGDESNCRGSPSPSPVLSISAFNYTDEEDTQEKSLNRAETRPPEHNSSEKTNVEKQKVTKPPQIKTLAKNR
ncbi:hypothetical protein C0993_009011 [Termitomyces sp. T159_Od127]|nr:hypothetical protein C0993_009011 [Termitomyces sp. T159_Od127]